MRGQALTELIFAHALMAGLGVALGLGAARLLRDRESRAARALPPIALLLLIAGLRLRDSLIFGPLVAAWPSALPLTDPTLPLTGLTLGSVWHRLPESRLRRVALSGSLALVALALILLPMLEPAPPGSPATQGRLCTQSDPSSCSAAAAATLLREHGLTMSERTMIPLCLTRRSGTTSLGVVRGLALATRGTPWRVEAGLRDTAGYDRIPCPALLTMRLPRFGDVDPRYERDWGWTRGTGHSVVLLDYRGDRVLMADPATGIEEWHVESIRVLWNGDLIRLVER